ncbi:RtcB family protein [Flammeovirgaceae bacterium SG7u.111]|nr:RtcB family protein [Flammeovirgaceae bacterium SG7u.132]WPO33224.1 RtcB family protein [Flammeovirgaceae bacterium SG7u.111]
MATQKLRGKDLRNIGFPEGRTIGVIIKVMANKAFKKKSKVEKLELLKEIKQNPEKFKSEELLGLIAAELLMKPEEKTGETPLREMKIPHTTYGEWGIEEGAKHQMHVAMKLPVAVAGALMPDAHFGYGLPIGGVLAAENAVIPYGVGVDIGCRMCLSLFDAPVNMLIGQRSRLKNILKENTKFGNQTFDKPMDDEVLTRPEFREIPKIRSLQDKAYQQIGSSGSGNHFVEFGIVKLFTADNEWNLAPGKYLSVLSHSGSRGFGGILAQYYTKIAMEQTILPTEARHLAWLSLDSEAGQEYWRAMNLAGDYASACHDHIHRRITKALGSKVLARVENHHNFAWKEQLADGRDVIVHRKGATPAGKGVLGIIPGSMTEPGFVVRGKGETKSINSASHGAGRVLSRSKAKSTLVQSEVKKLLKDKGVELIGGGLDEAPQAYKDINQVMEAQVDLVETLARFTPKIVRMSGE